MAIRVVVFSRVGYKIHKKEVCLKINIPKENYWILRIGVVRRCRKLPTFDLRSQFSMSKIIGICLNFFFIEKCQFRRIFFDNANFKITLLLKRCPIFDSSPLHQFSKFNMFRWVCWFLIFRILYSSLENSSTCITVHIIFNRL